MKKEEFTILVAEDDEMVRDVVLKILQDDGYSVFVANDGASALNLLRLEDIKMVLTDLRMPGADGMEVLRTALQINPQICVVLVTAYGTLDVVLEAVNEGAYDYLVKPFVMAQLQITVRNAFRLTSLLAENKELMTQLKETHRSLEQVKKSAGSNSKYDNTDSSDSRSSSEPGSLADSNDYRLHSDVLDNRDNKESIKKYSSLVNNLKTEKP